MSVKRILINNAKGQLRVARVDGQVLYDLEVEQPGRERKVDRIYKCKIVSIAPSLEAAFVDFGFERNGFLPLKEISPAYYSDQKKTDHTSIKDILSEGQQILVQVKREERGTKGAALTTYISLAGSYLVLMPNNPRAGGISRRIEGTSRDQLKEKLDQLEVPHGMGAIIRTAGMGRSVEELQWDLDVLLNLWKAIKEAGDSHNAPCLIHQESGAAIRVVRDHLKPDIGEILVDDEKIYKEVYEYIERARPNFIDKIKLYSDSTPLFSHFQIEKQIESAFQRNVRLPSGGEIVIDHTEALTAIDVNSAQATKGGFIEETALNTNLESAQEIARQLRIRDLGGLFVIDFIDMEEENNNRKVEECLWDALKTDRARIQLTHISRFGLLEMSRQRLRSSLGEASQVICPRCHGQGSIRSVKSQVLSIIRLIEEEALKTNAKQLQVQLPLDVATYLLNEQREDLEEIEKRHNMTILTVPNPYIEIPNYEITCIKKGARESVPLSHELLTTPKQVYELKKEGKKPAAEQPAVKNVALPPSPKKSRKPSIIKRLIAALLPKKKPSKKKRPPYKKEYNRYKKPYRSDSGRRFSSPRRKQHGSRTSHQQSTREPQQQSTREPQQQSTRGSQQKSTRRHYSERSSKPSSKHENKTENSSQVNLFSEAEMTAQIEAVTANLPRPQTAAPTKRSDSGQIKQEQESSQEKAQTTLIPSDKTEQNHRKRVKYPRRGSRQKSYDKKNNKESEKDTSAEGLVMVETRRQKSEDQKSKDEE